MDILKPWQFLIPVVSVCVGWTLNECSQWFRVRREDRKTLNVILYNLLEIYSLVKKLDEPGFENMFREIFAEIPELANATIPDDAIRIVAKTIHAIQIKSVLNHDLPAIKVTFDTSVVELSKIYPLIAFEINNSANIPSLFDVLQEIVAAIDRLANQTDEKMLPIEDFMKPMLVGHSIRNLQTDILDISRNLGVFTKYQVKKKIALLNMGMSKEAKASATAMLRNMISELK